MKFTGYSYDSKRIDIPLNYLQQVSNKKVEEQQQQPAGGAGVPSVNGNISIQDIFLLPYDSDYDDSQLEIESYGSISLINPFSPLVLFSYNNNNIIITNTTTT